MTVKTLFLQQGIQTGSYLFKIIREYVLIIHSNYFTCIFNLKSNITNGSMYIYIFLLVIHLNYSILFWKSIWQRLRAHIQAVCIPLTFTYLSYFNLSKSPRQCMYTCCQNSSMIINTISSWHFHGLYIAHRSQAVMTSDIWRSLWSKEYNHIYSKPFR